MEEKLLNYGVIKESNGDVGVWEYNKNYG